ARQFLFEHDAPIPRTFGALITRRIAREELRVAAQALLDPHPDRWKNGANFYRLYLGEVTAYVRADNRPFPPALEHHALPSADELVVLARPFDRGQDSATMLSIINASGVAKAGGM
ncbi:MAG: hypothetical protein WCO86_14250, partial [Planctomycetota bacterium]